MVFTRAQQMANNRVEWDEFVEDFNGKVLHRRNAITKNTGGSARSFSGTETLLDALWFNDTNDATEMVVFDDGTQKLESKWKFYFKSDADVKLQDWLYIKRTGATWGTPTSSSYTDRLQVERVLYQQAGSTIIGFVVHATTMQDNTMDTYIGAT